MVADNTKWMKKYITDFCMLEPREKAKEVKDFIIENYGASDIDDLEEEELRIIVDLVSTLEE